MNAKDFQAVAILRDGTSVELRAVRPDDGARLQRLFADLSPETVYRRFFQYRRNIGLKEIDRLIGADFDRDVALVAAIAGEIVGVARYAVLEPREGIAEASFLVADAHQGRGIGTLLLEHLAPIAARAGIGVFVADVLGENNRMLEVFAKSGYRVTRSLEGGVFHVRFPTEESEAVESARFDRDRTSAAQSVRNVLRPRSVAVVGASARKGTVGNTLIANLIGDGFKGPIYPINPHAQEIEGLRAYPSVSAVGAPVDLAVVAVPAKDVEAVATDCASAGVKGMVVVSSGFAEVSEEGRELQRRITALVRRSGMRMVGPNCVGIIETDLSLNATFAARSPPKGNIGLVSQSGALGLAMLDHARHLNVGVSSFVSVGNKADLSGNDLLSYWGEDPRTRVVVMYLESFGNPRRFAKIAPWVARRKPIVAVKSGRSAAGTRAASSHSASLANLDVAVDALFAQAGVVRTTTLEELYDVAALFATQPVPPGRRVGVVTNAGGPGILLADACEARGLSLPELAPETVEALRALLPAQAGLRNPVDMIASASPEQYRRAIELVGRDPNIDSVVVIFIPPMVIEPEHVAAAIAQGAGTLPATKPILSVFLAMRGAPEVLSGGPRGAIPTFSFPENAALALSAAVRYGEWKARPRGEVIELGRFSVDAARAVVERVLAESKGPAWLSTADVATVLRAAGIAFADAAEAEPTADAAQLAASRAGYPVVMKAVAPGLLHKSDAGGVILGLRSPEEVARAVETLRSRIPSLSGVMVQRMIEGGIEALVGVSTDPTFGPLLVAGMGGVNVELFQDVAFRLPPVSDLDAGEMLDGLRSKKLLDGWRGAPPGDRAGLISVVQRVSALVEAIPEIREMDLNPVKVLPPGRGAVVVDARIRVGPANVA